VQGIINSEKLVVVPEKLTEKEGACSIGRNEGSTDIIAKKEDKKPSYQK
jgi:hypothetical protein